jgi:hypothetical protein
LPGHARDRLEVAVVVQQYEPRLGTRIGPLYADSSEIAHALLSALSAGSPVALDVPDVNPRAVRLVEDFGFEPTFECARMYTGPVPDLDTDGVFANTTLELG